MTLSPLCIAVTGHRDLRPADLPTLRKEVAAVFKTLQELDRSKPLMLLSALAEGADQLVAEVALEQGIAVRAVLPMPIDIYRDQMPPDVQINLDRLRVRVDASITLPLGNLSLAQLRSSEEARATSYEALAHYLVGHCQVLIALWDGLPSDKPGGTCRVVNYARFGVAPCHSESVPSTCTAVYHILTPRLSNRESVGEVHTTLLDCPHL
jgi:hypothetical protein